MTPVTTFEECAVHPGSLSVGTCKRCGRFMCDDCCFSRSPPACKACGPAFVDPLGVLSAPFSFMNSVTGGWKLLGPQLPLITLAVIAVTVPRGFVLDFFMAHAEDQSRVLLTNLKVQYFYDFFISVLASIFAQVLMIAGAENQKLTLVETLQQTISVYPRVLATQWTRAVRLVLWSLLFVFPALWKRVMWALVLPVSIRLRRERQPLNLSADLVEGHGGQIFLLVVACTTLQIVPGAISFVVSLTVADQLPSDVNTIIDLVSNTLTQLLEVAEGAVFLAAFYSLMGQKKDPMPPMAWTSAHS